MVLAAAMAVGLILLAALGVVMAYVMFPKRRWTVTLVLLAGVVLPAAFMLI